MLEQEFERLYLRFRLLHYQELFSRIRERSGSLSATEASAAEVIFLLGEPTIKEFADFLNISQSNATYKVNSLIRKGYLERQNSAVDRREYHLVLSEKFYNYAGLLSSYEMTVMERIKERFSAEDVEKFDNMLSVISKELMPECE